MKTTVASVLFLLLVLTAPVVADSGPDWENVEITTTHLAGPIWMVSGAGGNVVASIGADGILLVDDDLAPLAARLRATLSGLAEPGTGHLRFVLNTHWHHDHTGGNARMGKEAVIIAHDNVRRRLMEEQTNALGSSPSLPADAWPVITFQQSISLHFNGEEIRLLHLPGGHTDGDAVVWFMTSNVVATGDLFFNGAFPFVDLDTGGDVERYIANVESILGRLPAGARIVPGHGPLADAGDLEENRRVLRATVGLIRTRVAEGDDLDEILGVGLPPEWRPWGEGFIDTPTWIRTVYRSLTRSSR